MEKGPKQTLGSSECFRGFRDSQPSTCHDSRIFSSQAEVHTSVCCIVSTLSCLFKIYFISLQYFFKTWLWSGAHTALPSSNPSSPTAGCVTWAQPLNRPESALSFLYREISKTPPVKRNPRVSRCANCMVHLPPARRPARRALTIPSWIEGQDSRSPREAMRGVQMADP